MATRPVAKIKLTWWALRDAAEPVIHAVREDRKKAMCGGKVTKNSFEVKGPKTIEKHRKCVRCLAQLERFELMR